MISGASFRHVGMRFRAGAGLIGESSARNGFGKETRNCKEFLADSNRLHNRLDYNKVYMNILDCKFRFEI